MIESRAIDNGQDMFLKGSVPKYLIILNAIAAVGYFLLLSFGFSRGNTILFTLLIAGEVFHLWQLGSFLWTIWDTDYEAPRDASYTPDVDVFITVAGEPVEIIEETARAALRMQYAGRKKIFFLNDGLVAKKENWHEVELLAKKLGVECITRATPGGAKAGNINNALRATKGALVAVFDADHVPHADFLEKTVPYFSELDLGFVQTPQYYKNSEVNDVARGAWDQQALFFGPICRGKNRLNSVTMCGTNMVIRREAILAVGGMCEESIAEDFATGMFMHEQGWKSVYVPEILAEGLAPEDFLSYYKQQFRWARGGLDVIFRYRFIFRSGLSFSQKLQYLASVSYFFSGAVVIMNALIPLLFFFTGIVPFQISTMILAAVFLPYIFLTLYVLQRSCSFSFSFRSIAFSMAGWTIHLRALFAALTGEKTSFSVTSKKALTGNFAHLVIPHIVYIALVLVGMTLGVAREGLSPSVVSNFAWAVLNAVIFTEFIAVALPVSWFEFPSVTFPRLSRIRTQELS